MMKQIVFTSNIIRLEERNNMNTENNYISGQTIRSFVENLIAHVLIVLKKNIILTLTNFFIY